MADHLAGSELSEARPRGGATALGDDVKALLRGSLGVLTFSLTFPATKVAVAELDGTIVGLGRAVGAAVLAAILLAIRPRQQALLSRAESAGYRAAGR